MRNTENKDIINFIYILVSFPPIIHQNSIRALEISKRLVKERISPIFLTQKISKKSQVNYSLLNELPPSLKIYRTFYFESINRYRFFIFFNIFRLAFFLGVLPLLFLKIKKLLRKKRNIKFIYASGPHFYTHIIGYLLKKKSNLPLIVEYRDPWSFNPYNEEKVPWLFKKIDLSIEKRILKSADLIITVSSALNDFMRNKFPILKNKPIYSIANGLNIKKIEKYSKPDAENIIFTFTGTLYDKRSIEPLLMIISRLKNEKFFDNFKFLIKIFGTHRGIDLKDIIKRLRIENLVYLGGMIPRSKALDEILKSDLAIHIGENLDYPTIAFKVWDYLSCQKKILYLGNENTYTANFIKENNFGTIIPINNLEHGKKRLKRLLNDIKNNKYDNSIDNEKLRDFTWEKKAKKFLKIVINKIVK